LTDERIVERFVTFDCEGETCVGILATSATQTRTVDVGVIVIVGGPQYRVGSHRQFVELARALARSGVCVLRFDCRGMGDSDGVRRAFDDLEQDIDAAIGALKRETGVGRVILWGLCDGASAALMFAPDARVAGIVAANPWVRSEQIEAASQLRHHYAKRLVSVTFWRAALSDGLRLQQRLRDLYQATTRALRTRVSNDPPFLARMHDGWMRFQRPILWMLSGRDYTAREFEQWVAQDVERRRLLDGRFSTVFRCNDADHTFSEPRAAAAVAARTIEWIAQISRAS